MLPPRPDSVMPELLPDSFAFPGTSADHERSHTLECANDRSNIRTAAAFPPANKPIVGCGLHDYVRNAVTVYQRAYLCVGVRDAYGRKLKFGNFHAFFAAPHRIAVVRVQCGQLFRSYDPVD